MREFDSQLLRLKQVLRVTEDQQAAEALGLSKAAFADRKRRDAFPVEKLRLLAADRPELRGRVDYVLTGATGDTTLIEAKEPAARWNDPIDQELWVTVLQAVETALAEQRVSLDPDRRLKLYRLVYDLSRVDGTLNQSAVKRVVEFAIEVEPRRPK